MIPVNIKIKREETQDKIKQNIKKKSHVKSSRAAEPRHPTELCLSSTSSANV